MTAEPSSEQQGIGNFPTVDAVKTIMDRHTEERQTAAQIRAHKWSKKSNRMKAEALIAKVDPASVRERDAPKIALAQVHATLALLDFHRGIPEDITNYERF